MAEQGVCQVVAGIAEIWVVKDVEELDKEAQAQLLPQCKAPLKNHIRLGGSESTQDGAAEIALGTRREQCWVLRELGPSGVTAVTDISHYGA